MAQLTEAQRTKILKGFMRYISPKITELPCIDMLSPDIKEAIDAVDTWVDSNASSYNSALPTTFRNNAGTQLKSLLLVAVVCMRYDEELLKLIFGSLD